MIYRIGSIVARGSWLVAAMYDEGVRWFKRGMDEDVCACGGCTEVEKEGSVSTALRSSGSVDIGPTRTNSVVRVV